MKNTYRLSILTFLLLIFILFSNSCGSSNITTIENTNSVIFSFVYMGDDQIGYNAWIETRAENPSSANIPQLMQNFSDISTLNPKPAFVVMGGDLVMNEAEDDGQILTEQLNGWSDVFASIPSSSDINFIPIIGNHESNTHNIALGDQYPIGAFSSIFIDWVASNGYDKYAGNGPKPEGENLDKLVKDESKLTYSFDYLNKHFIIINTDTETTEINPVTNKSYKGWIPVNWVIQDIQNAQANPNISVILIMSHKPINSPEGPTDAIINTPQYPFGTMLLTAIQENSKARVSLCSHMHSFFYEKLEDTNNCWQFIAGNAGAELNNDSIYWSGEPGFGFLLVKIYSNGNIGITSYKRQPPPPPQKFYEDTPIPPAPAVGGQEIIIYP